MNRSTSLFIVLWSSLIAMTTISVDASMQHFGADESVAERNRDQEQQALALLLERQALEDRERLFHEKLNKTLNRTTRARFFGNNSGQTGIRFSGSEGVVTAVVQGSPAQSAGIAPGDRLVAIDDVQADGSADAGTRLQWAVRRLSAGDLSTIVIERNGMLKAVSVPVVSRSELWEARRNARQAHTGETAAQRQSKRRQQTIQHQQLNSLHLALAEDRFGSWDGLLFLSIGQGLEQHFGIEQGVLVLQSADPDHPLQMGDVLTRVGKTDAKSARHAVQLLYEYETQALVPLLITRDRQWLTLEMPYPRSERLELVLERLVR